MPVDDRILALLHRPAESLNVEIKTWLDPATSEGEIKLAKAIIAIRNRNGGYLVIGLNNVTRLADRCPLDGDLTQHFHVDVIQAIVSRYASTPFEIAVEYPEFQGQVHPIIVVPEGVRVPVVSKRDFKDNDRYHIRKGDLYFRTLNANGVASSAIINPRDYAGLMDICFENREADIGRFLRRQLGAADVERLRETILALMSAVPADLRPVAANEAVRTEEDPPGDAGRVIEPIELVVEESVPPEDLSRLAATVIERGDEAFLGAIRRRGLPEGREHLLEGLTMRVAMVLHPQHPDALPTKEFMNRVDSANPQYTGWPVWLDSRSFSNADDRPEVRDHSWQAHIVALDGGWADHLEFLLFDPRGQFYLRRLMQDDLSDKVSPGSALDVILMLYRIAEVLAVGISIAKASGWDESNFAGFAFEWAGLAGRKLQPWVNRLSSIGRFGSHVANDPSAKSFVRVSLDTPHAALAPYVQQASAPLFAAFGGFEPPPEVIEDCVRRLVERKMEN